MDAAIALDLLLEKFARATAAARGGMLLELGWLGFPQCYDFTRASSLSP
jgi:hypothetical protein